MDKRSWPWKKKSSGKTLICNDVWESSPLRASNGSDGQLIPVSKLDRIRTSAPASPHRADDKIKRLNERLLAADDLAKQHATVAEEAVSGWEISKAEYVSVKQQLDTVVEQKQAVEVRVLHLDGALKECMQQLRQFREDQEQEIHNAVIKRCRDWDKMRVELEERLADTDQRLMESENQRNLMCKTMQEQAEAVGDLGRTRMLAEAEIKKLQVQIQTLEKENTSLKYEIVLLNKELNIRNQEREINGRSIDMASRQQDESNKRITNLEAECQRLRALVRKKLPGPAALLQMKLEAGVGVEKGNFYSKRRSGGKPATTPTASLADYAVQADRHLVLDEDFMKSPRTRPGFYVAERFLGTVPSHRSISDDGHDDTASVADSWMSSGCTTEAAYVQKEKSSLFNSERSNMMLEKLNSTDDFLEIERLVSLPSEKQGMQPHPSSISKQVLAKDAELQAANKLCADVSKKLAAKEEQLKLLQSKNMANEVNLLNIHQKMIGMREALERGDLEMVLEDLKKALSAFQCNSMVERHAYALKLSTDADQDHSYGTIKSFEGSQFDESAQVQCYSEYKASRIGPELTTVIRKLVGVVEDLVSEGMAQHPATSGQIMNSASKPRVLELEASMKNFYTLSQQYLYGKAELVQVMTELCSVLSQMHNVSSIKGPGSLSNRMKWRPDAVQGAEQEVLSDVGSPVSLTSNSDGSELLAAKVFSADDRLANSLRVAPDEELHKVRAEKENLASRLKGELTRTATLDYMLAELKLQKSELENKLQEEREKANSMKSQLLDFEQLVATLRARLQSAELSGNVAEKSLSTIVAAKGKIESQLEESKRELVYLNEKLRTLESVLDEEQRKNAELQMKKEELEALVKRKNASGSEGDKEMSYKEQEITDAAEKHAEWQHAISVIGKQLKDMAATHDASSSAIKASAAQNQEGAPEGEPSADGNAVSYTASGLTDASSIAFNVSSEESDSGSEDDDKPEKSSLLHADADKQLVVYVPKPATKKKTRHLFGADMFKSPNLEPPAAPRKTGSSSFSKLFSKNKNPS